MTPPLPVLPREGSGELLGLATCLLGSYLALTRFRHHPRAILIPLLLFFISSGSIGAAGLVGSLGGPVFLGSALSLVPAVGPWSLLPLTLSLALGARRLRLIGGVTGILGVAIGVSYALVPSSLAPVGIVLSLAIVGITWRTVTPEQFVPLPETALVAAGLTMLFFGPGSTIARPDSPALPFLSGLGLAIVGTLLVAGIWGIRVVRPMGAGPASPDVSPGPPAGAAVEHLVALPDSEAEARAKELAARQNGALLWLGREHPAQVRRRLGLEATDFEGAAIRCGGLPNDLHPANLLGLYWTVVGFSERHSRPIVHIADCDYLFSNAGFIETADALVALKALLAERHGGLIVSGELMMADEEKDLRSLLAGGV